VVAAGALVAAWALVDAAVIVFAFEMSTPRP